MPPSTMRQVTILQLGPTELNNLREGELIKIPISVEMSVLLQAGMADLYLGLVGARKSPKRDALPESHVAGELPTRARHTIVQWTDEEAYKVFMEYEKLGPEHGIGPRLRLAQEKALPPERHRLFNSTGATVLQGIRNKATGYARRTGITPPTSEPPKTPTVEGNCFVAGCDGGGKTPAGLAGHLASKHGKRLPKVDGVARFQCRECKSKKEFNNWSEFLGHLQAIHGKR